MDNNNNFRAVKPQILPYRFHRLKEVPMRLWRAPALPDWMTTPSPEPAAATSSNAFDITSADNRTAKPAKFRKARSFAKATMAEVKLADVLNGRHLPPLTLREFEDYLAHVERSPENLYFIFWLKNYHQEYRAWESSVCPNQTANSQDPTISELMISLDKNEHHSPPYETDAFSTSATNPSRSSPLIDSKSFIVPQQLQQSFQLAMTTFYGTDPKSPSVLELNLSSAVAKKTKIDAEHSFDPSIFKAAKDEALTMLEQSMRCWVTYAAGNADNQRIVFAVVVGIGSILIAFACSISIYYFTSNIGLRLASSPILFLGVATFTCSLHRMCPILWLFAPARQCHSWELIRESASTGEHNVPLQQIKIDRPGHLQDDVDEKKIEKENQSGGVGLEITPHTAVPDWDSALNSHETQDQTQFPRDVSSVSTNPETAPWSNQFKGTPPYLPARSVSTSIPMGMTLPMHIPTAPSSSPSQRLRSDDEHSNFSSTTVTSNINNNHQSVSHFNYFTLSRFIFTPSPSLPLILSSSPSSPSPLSTNTSPSPKLSTHKAKVNGPSSPSLSLSSMSLSSFTDTPIFAPVTRVMNPLINRFQRAVILRSSTFGFIFVVAWIITWLALPLRLKR